MQAPHFFIVTAFSSLDGALGQIIAQDVQRIDRVHALATAFGVVGFTGDAGQVIHGPAVEAGQVDKVIAHYL
ncbi:hypothetical protein D3C84_923290 [compost metagenome]